MLLSVQRMNKVHYETLCAALELAERTQGITMTEHVAARHALDSELSTLDYLRIVHKEELAKAYEETAKEHDRIRKWYKDTDTIDGWDGWQ